MRAVVDEKADFVGKGELCIGLNGNRFGNPEEHPQQNLRQAFCVILLLQEGIDRSKAVIQIRMAYNHAAAQIENRHQMGKQCAGGVYPNLFHRVTRIGPVFVIDEVPDDIGISGTDGVFLSVTNNVSGSPADVFDDKEIPLRIPLDVIEGIRVGNTCQFNVQDAVFGKRVDKP